MPPIKKKAITKFTTVDIFEPVNILYDRLNLKNIILISPSLALTIDENNTDTFASYNMSDNFCL